MSQTIPNDIWTRVEAIVAEGDYKSEFDVLRDALTMLERRRADLAAIDEGLADMRAGRHKSLEQFDADFRKRHNIPDDD